MSGLKSNADFNISRMELLAIKEVLGEAQDLIGNAEEAIEIIDTILYGEEND